MVFSIVVITVGTFFIRRSDSCHTMFKVTFISYGTSLILMFISIPWEFSPFVSRSMFRFIY
jgi:multisubunit Na+/H+ antiporter MnhC subunit